jgi:hypothetical protein
LKVVQGDDDRIDPAREGLEHLQAAAHEMIAAARSMLDACEELISDPKAGETLAALVGSVARAVGGITGAAVPGDRTDDHDEGPRVERIKIS